MITQAANIFSDLGEAHVAPDRAGTKLLTPEDVASLFSVDKRTVLKWARDRKLERVKISGKVILFTRESVNIFVKSRIHGVESVTAPKAKSRARAEKPITRKGGVSQSSRKSSWRSLREEATQWL